MPVRIIRSHAGLRGLAALLVVAYHLQFGAAYKLPFETATHAFTRGYLAVDLFFVLSGFIIAYVNRADRRTAVTQAEVGRFLLARFARLYPLLAFSLVAMLACRLAVNSMLQAAHRPPIDIASGRSLLTLASQALLVNAWTPGLLGWNIPTWSISAELFAYLLFPLAVSAHARTPRAVEALMAAAAVAFYAAVAGTSGSLDIIAGWAPARCVAGFWLGMLLFHHRAAVEAWPPAALSIGQLLAIAGIAAALAAPVDDPVIVPCFVLLVATSWTDRGIVARALGHPAFLWLGDISYSVYLLHVPVIDAAFLPWGHLVAIAGLAPAPARLAWIILTYALVIGASALTFAFVERPARQWDHPGGTRPPRAANHRLGSRAMSAQSSMPGLCSLASAVSK